MSSENIVQDKSYEFSKNIVCTIYEIQKEKKEFVLTKQLLRSGTSIGANIEEAIGGFSKKDFKYKMSIAYKEARESKYWIRLLKDTNLLAQELAFDLLEKVEELLKILFKIIKNTK